MGSRFNNQMQTNGIGMDVDVWMGCGWEFLTVLGGGQSECFTSVGANRHHIDHPTRD